MESKFLKIYNLVMEDILKESRFKNSEVSKHSYFSDVIQYILDNKSIKIGDNGEETIELNLNNDDISNLELAKVNNDLSLFNNVLKKYEKSLSWTKIFKGTFSGFDKKITGQSVEPYICYIYNTNDETILNNLEIDNKLKLSIINSAKTMNNIFKNDNYVAVHVDGNDIDKSILSTFNIKLANLFKGNFSVFNKNVIKPDCFNKKDNWCKADILLISIDMNEDELLEIDSLDDLNSYLNQCIDNEILIPVSLKENKSGNFVFYKVKTDNPDDLTIKLLNEIENVDFIQSVPKKDSDSGNNASCYLKSNNGLQIQFRRQTSENSNANRPSIEVSGKHARGGKGLGLIIFDLFEESSRTFKFTKFESPVDFENKMNSIGVSINNPELFNFICYSAFFDIYKMFLNKNKNSTIIDFFKYVYKMCAGYENPVKFWILK